MSQEKPIEDNGHKSGDEHPEAGRECDKIVPDERYFQEIEGGFYSGVQKNMVLYRRLMRKSIYFRIHRFFNGKCWFHQFGDHFTDLQFFLI